MESNMDRNDIEIQQEERIMSFLRGEMTEAEESIFMDDLQKDTDFKAKAINMARLAKGISQVGNENDKVLKEAMLSSDEFAIKNITEQVTSSRQQQSVAANKAVWSSSEKAITIKFNRKYVTILSIAASLLFIIYFGFMFNRYNKTTSLGNQFAMTHETSVARGGDNTKIEAEVGELVNNVYNNKDLSKTLKRLAILWEVSTAETYNDYTEFAPEIGWALATGYLKDNNKEDAKEVLEKMANLYEEDDPMGQKVRELLKKIHDL